MEIRYFWLFDGEAQTYFKFHYQLGQENLGGYHTKSFTVKDTQRARPFYVHSKLYPQLLVRALMPSTQWEGCKKNRESLHTYEAPTNSTYSSIPSTTATSSINTWELGAATCGSLEQLHVEAQV